MFYDTDNIKIHNENCLATMERMQGDSIDAIVTDPPYGLGKEPDALEMLKAWVDGETKAVNGSGFMGKKWDAFVPQPEIWKAAYRVLKPGGYLLSFFGTRTYDWGVMSIRLGGFEIRDCVSWIYGSGFPKSRDVSKAIDLEAGVKREVIGKTNVCGAFKQAKQIEQGYRKENGSNGYKGEREGAFITAPATPQAKQWDGWGTALKPAMELIVVARKPLSEKTIAKNVLKWGTGGINIEECRVGNEKFESHGGGNPNPTSFAFKALQRGERKWTGRWPANVILDESEEVRRGFPDRDGELHNKQTTGNSHFVPGVEKSKRGYSFKDTGSASRFYYCAKCSKLDRDEGLTGFEYKERTTQGRDIVKYIDRKDGKGVVPVNAQIRPRRNNHPTVKPTSLMQYLIKLVTQPGGVIYDPFMGSGSTGKAALLEKFRFIGSELNQEDCEIAKARIIWASKQLKQLTLFEELPN